MNDQRENEIVAGIKDLHRQAQAELEQALVDVLADDRPVDTRAILFALQRPVTYASSRGSEPAPEVRHVSDNSIASATRHG